MAAWPPETARLGHRREVRRGRPAVQVQQVSARRRTDGSSTFRRNPRTALAAGECGPGPPAWWFCAETWRPRVGIVAGGDLRAAIPSRLRGGRRGRLAPRRGGDGYRGSLYNLWKINNLCIYKAHQTQIRFNIF